MSDGSVEPRASSGYAMPLNTWTFGCGTWNGTTLSVYVNGVLAGTSSRSGALTSATVQAQIGAGESTAPSHNYFDGSIEDVMIFNSALSQGQIDTLYRSNLNS